MLDTESKYRLDQIPGDVRLIISAEIQAPAEQGTTKDEWKGKRKWRDKEGRYIELSSVTLESCSLSSHLTLRLFFLYLHLE